MIRHWHQCAFRFVGTSDSMHVRTLPGREYNRDTLDSRPQHGRKTTATTQISMRMMGSLRQDLGLGYKFVFSLVHDLAHPAFVLYFFLTSFSFIHFFYSGFQFLTVRCRHPLFHSSPILCFCLWYLALHILSLRLSSRMYFYEFY